MSEWISVNDKLPPELYTDVLIYYNRICEKCQINSEEEYISIAYYGENGWSMSEPLDADYFPMNAVSEINITHWMPLPNAPKEESK